MLLLLLPIILPLTGCHTNRSIDVDPAAIQVQVQVQVHSSLGMTTTTQHYPPRLLMLLLLLMRRRRSKSCFARRVRTRVGLARPHWTAAAPPVHPRHLPPLLMCPLLLLLLLEPAMPAAAAAGAGAAADVVRVYVSLSMCCMMNGWTHLFSPFHASILPPRRCGWLVRGSCLSVCLSVCLYICTACHVTPHMWTLCLPAACACTGAGELELTPCTAAADRVCRRLTDIITALTDGAADDDAGADDDDDAAAVGVYSPSQLLPRCTAPHPTTPREQVSLSLALSLPPPLSLSLCVTSCILLLYCTTDPSPPPTHTPASRSGSGGSRSRVHI